MTPLLHQTLDRLLEILASGVVMENEELTSLTADIVAAHVSNNSVAISDLPLLIESVHHALSGLSEGGEPEETKPEPVVSIRASKKNDKLICLVCGEGLKSLKRHLNTAHDMTPADYREAFNLPGDYPMIAPDYAAKRSELAKKIGLGRKPKAK